MIPTQTLSEFPEFGNSSTKVKPDDTKYSAGFVNADVVPYEWVNYLHNKASVGITDLNSGVSSIEKELNAVVTAGGATPSESSNNQVLNAIKYLIAQAKSEAILAAHPIGSLYWSSKDTDPNKLFGGTWTRIKDKFILACGDTYKTVNATGGASTVTLTTSNMPSHSHSFTPAGKITMNAHSHGLNNHTHSFTPSGTVAAHSHEFRWSGSHTHGLIGMPSKTTDGVGSTCFSPDYYSSNYNLYPAILRFGSDFNRYTYYTNTNTLNSGSTNVISSTTITVSGHTGAASPSFTGSTGTTGGNSGNTTSTTSTGSFSGTAGTTGTSGSGTAFSIMPPYITKYCWERTA
jgi:hypothetical protein